MSSSIKMGAEIDSRSNRIRSSMNKIQHDSGKKNKKQRSIKSNLGRELCIPKTFNLLWFLWHHCADCPWTVFSVNGNVNKFLFLFNLALLDHEFKRLILLMWSVWNNYDQIAVIESIESKGSEACHTMFIVHLFNTLHHLYRRISKQNTDAICVYYGFILPLLSKQICSYCPLFFTNFVLQRKMTRKSHTRRVLTPLCTEIKVGTLLLRNVSVKTNLSR